jgi:hypothetical protein
MGKYVIGSDAHKKMNSENRHWEMIYYEPYLGSDYHFHDPVFGLFGSGVNFSKKYR